MPKITNFVKDICTKISAISLKITKRMYREMAVITLGALVIAVTSLVSAGFGGGGKNVVMANMEERKAEAESSEDEAEAEAGIPSAIIEESALQTAEEGQSEEDVFFVTKELQEDISHLESNVEEQIDNFQQLREEAQEYKKQKEAQEERERYLESVALALGISSFSEEDYENLCRIIQSEAGICDAKGKILVGNVVINRVKNSNFPDTVSGVILYPGQFTPVSDGSFYEYEVTQHTRDAVERLMSGEDYSQGALFFMSNKGSITRGKRWIRSRLQFLFEHQGHEFYK